MFTINEKVPKTLNLVLVLQSNHVFEFILILKFWFISSYGHSVNGKDLI
jgi:hypothetical protein